MQRTSLAVHRRGSGHWSCLTVALMPQAQVDVLLGGSKCLLLTFS